MSTRAREQLIKYQENSFGRIPTGICFQGFDQRAYPETALKLDLDYIGKALDVRRKSKEICEDYRERILQALEAPDEKES